MPFGAFAPIVIRANREYGGRAKGPAMAPHGPTSEPTAKPIRSGFFGREYFFPDG
jgi:hypothetical protein